MNFLASLRQSVAKSINIYLEAEYVDPADFVYPPDNNKGDLTLPLFSLSAKLEKNPVELAKELELNIVSKFFSLSATGPYLNFKFNSLSAERILLGIEQDGDNYGFLTFGAGREVMIEYSNINSHKEYHLGHLRNIAYGDAIAKIYAASGYKVWPVSYINDFGIHVAKTIWGWRQFKADLPADSDKGFVLGQAYVKAVNALKDNQIGEKEVSAIMQSIETMKGDDFKDWQETRAWSLDYFAKIYAELDIHFKEYYFESEYIVAGKKLVAELLEKGILKKSEGAIIADLEQYGLGVLVVLRSDGTATYPVADLALAQEKFKRHDLFKSLYVVDKRQSLYFRQLFKILELMGYKAEMTHLPYEFVKLPNGMMSSRSGNTIIYRDLYIQIFDKIKSEILNRHADWEETKVVDTANSISVGILKFEMLKVGADKIITFDINEAMLTSGYTSVYLQYAGARLQSILRKADSSKSADISLLSHAKESFLVSNLSRYPEIVEKAQTENDPSIIAKYLFELTQLFNDYYHEVNILNAEEGIKLARLKLLEGVKQVLSNGLSLLGIAFLEEI
ncbi:MAG: arginine--tRNA ligase [Patescibacteria group bacterium]|nr:arginine--tRNA ligase [Patescibacteria group bacterium]